MLFDRNEENEKDDFFDNENVVEEKPKEEKKPVYKPEDPDYWEEEESDWEHLKPRKPNYLPLWIITAIVIIGLIIGCWLRFFSPYVEDASQYGYIEHIERRGTIFKTYEGTLIPYKELMDTTRIYSRDFVFSVKDDKTAAALRQAQFDARPVRVEYKKYHATVPWRGSSKIVIVKVDSIDPEKILPPEFAPRNLR